ncbi:MAG TPA: hypothetical protein VGL98_13565 [Gammaproteobacteria bacterium]
MNNVLRKARRSVGLLAIVLGIPATASAQAATDHWTIELTPYLWAAGLDGDTAANGTGSEIDTDYKFFSLDNLDFALGTAVEARRGRWAMLGDAMYVEFSDAFERAPGSEVEVSGGFVETVGAMQASNGRPLELLFGLRYVALKSTVDIAPVPRASTREKWLDPIVGLRFAYDFNDRWSVRLRGDVGGAGISSNSSELATNVSALFGWRISDKVTLRGGYRMLQMDFDGDSLVLDATLQGYVIGASWTF